MIFSTIDDAKNQFITIYKSLILERVGSDSLLKWLEGTDFFVAPASSHFHLSVKGGLVMHSLNVYSRLQSLFGGELAGLGIQPQSMAIVSLLHDLCKTGYYAMDTKNVKDEMGNWRRVPYYTIQDSFLYGHGEKSVFMVERFMMLTTEEAIAIRWHMGHTEGSNPQTVSKVFEEHPLALALHVSDMVASFMDETKEKCRR